MKAHRIEAKLTKTGTLTLNNLPFQAGDAVEIIILERHLTSLNSNPASLRGKVIRYDDPFDSAISVEDWEVLQ
ncbi:hypothetical protein [Coleofasciculus sp. E2-BRE-01]|jgi:hypothetical protein|uniref:hypothetical protein n=1 Tax=unclassified Coleofasciculus TaxID=2692782 RepID=UPI0032FC49C6